MLLNCMQELINGHSRFVLCNILFFLVWLSSVDTIGLSEVPFLPVDPSLSTIRNQGRQKLARFSSPELNSLVYDILVDTQRRHLIAERGNLLILNRN